MDTVDRIDRMMNLVCLSSTFFIGLFGLGVCKLFMIMALMNEERTMSRVDSE